MLQVSSTCDLIDEERGHARAKNPSNFISVLATELTDIRVWAVAHFHFLINSRQHRQFICVFTIEGRLLLIATRHNHDWLGLDSLFLFLNDVLLLLNLLHLLFVRWLILMAIYPKAANSGFTFLLFIFVLLSYHIGRRWGRNDRIKFYLRRLAETNRSLVWIMHRRNDAVKTLW